MVRPIVWRYGTWPSVLSFQAILDPDCQQALVQMTEHYLPPRSVMAKFSVLWRHDEGISAKLHLDYLEELGLTAGSWLQQAVDLGVAKIADAWTETDSVEGELLGEISQHWLTVRDRVRWFAGRKDVVSLVQSYVLSDDDKPLVLHGSPGIGKSSIIAKVAAEVFQCVWKCKPDRQ